MISLAASGAGASGLTDWVTAAATAITALLVGFSGFVAWLAYRRDKRRDLPVIEPCAIWEDDKGLGHYLHLRLIITNRLDETVILNTVSVRRPRGALVSAGMRVNTGYSGGTLAATRGSSDTVVLGETISSAGSAFLGAMDGHSIRIDTAELSLYIFPPSTWLSGEVLIILRVSSKALTIRDKRMVIKSRVPAATVKRTDEAASNTD
jgi:hypothetical protein